MGDKPHFAVRGLCGSRRVSVSRRRATCFLAVLALLLSFALPAGSFGAPVAPGWMPNSPILAGSQVILLWLPVPGAVKYNVYLDGKRIGESASVQFIVPAPESPGDHKYEITSVDGGGAESPKSIPGVVKIVTIEPPTDVFSRATEGRVALKWNMVKGAVIYNIYRSEKDGAEGKLVSSVQSDSFTDTGLQVGKVYFYTVSSKDLAGKESPRSKVHRVEIPRPVEKAAEAAKIEMKIFPSRELATSRLRDENRIKLYQGLTVGPDGFVYVADASRNAVLKVDKGTMEVVKTIGCGKPEEAQCKVGNFIAIAIGAEGLYVLDYQMKKAMVFDLAEGKFKFEFEVKNPADKQVVDAVPAAQKAKGVGIDGIAVDDKAKVLYIADANFNTIHKFDLGGKFLGTIGHGGPTEKDLLGPALLALNPSGELLYIAQPLTHIIQVMDVKTGEVVRTVGRRHNAYIGGFIGVSGMSVDSAGNLYVSDSGVHTIQYFDGKTGTYLGHVGDETGKPDEDQKNRASLDGIQFPVGVSAVGGNGLCFFRGDKNQVTCREMVRK